MIPPRVLALATLAAACSAGTESLPPGANDAGARADAAAPASTQTFTIGARAAPTDVLLVVDNSSSMGRAQARLAAAIPAFVEALGDADHRLAVLTTDTGGPARNGLPEVGGEVTTTYGPAPYFVIGESDRMACFDLDVEHSCIRGTDRIVDLARFGRERTIEALRESASVGTCGSGDERGIESVLTGLRKPCNERFLRPEANLALVLISDEDDGSMHPSALMDLVTAAGKRPEQLGIAVIAGVIDGRPAPCGAGERCGESVCSLGPPLMDPRAQAIWNSGPDACRSCSYFAAPDCCSALPAHRLVAFAESTAALVAPADPSLEPGCRGGAEGRSICRVESVCDATYEPSLRRIAREVITRWVPDPAIELDPPAPCPADVRVTLRRAGGGVRELDPSERSVSDDGRSVRILAADLAIGAEISVETTCR